MKNTLLGEIQQSDGEMRNILPSTSTKNVTPLDTGLKWTPLAILTIANVAGLKTKSNFRRQAVRFIISEAILNAALLPAKKAFNRKRPNGQTESMPSGHAATGFLSSQILYEELKDSSPALSYSGYALSFATCLLRLYHNKHWFSDVAAGAFLGILSAKAALKFTNHKHKTANKYLRPDNLLM